MIMKSKKRNYRRLSFFFFTLAISLLLFNTYRNVMAEKKSQIIIEQLDEEDLVEKDFPSMEEEQEYLTKNIDGVEIIGSLFIPKIDKNLPVTASWSQELMNTYPNKYRGKKYSDPLIIMAHNYRSQFGALYRLEEGDKVIFTDVIGRQKIFQVAGKEIIRGQEVEEMIQTDYPLTLFTCTLDSLSRLTVRFTKIEQRCCCKIE